MPNIISFLQEESRPDSPKNLKDSRETVLDKREKEDSLGDSNTKLKVRAEEFEVHGLTPLRFVNLLKGERSEPISLKHLSIFSFIINTQAHEWLGFFNQNEGYSMITNFLINPQLSNKLKLSMLICLRSILNNNVKKKRKSLKKKKSNTQKKRSQSQLC